MKTVLLVCVILIISAFKPEFFVNRSAVANLCLIIFVLGCSISDFVGFGLTHSAEK